MTLHWNLVLLIIAFVLFLIAGMGAFAVLFSIVLIKVVGLIAFGLASLVLAWLLGGPVART